MKIQRIIGMTIICLAISSLAMAQPQGAPAGGPGGPSQGNLTSAKVDMTPVYEAMDTNKDGKVDKAEWLASGMTQDSYDKLFTQMLDKDKDGYLTKADILAAIPMFEVDTNKDGKVSIEEFVEANKKAAEQMAAGGQGGAPGGAPGGSTPGSQQ